MHTSKAPLERVLHALRDPALELQDLTLFNNIDSWLDSGKLRKLTGRFLYPHAEPYFSVLRPTFVSSLQGADCLSRFAFLSAQDGILGLTWFFRRYPTPPEKSGTLLIPQNLGWLVPPAWDSVVAYYSLQNNNTQPLPSARSTVYLALSLIDEKQCSPSYITQLATQLRTFDKIYCLPYYNLTHKPCGLQYTGQIAPNLELFQQLTLSLGRPVEFTSLPELENTTLESASFTLADQHSFYVGSSFLEHFFLSRGAAHLSLSTQTKPTPESTVPLSFYHSAHLYSQSTFELSIRKNITEKVSQFSQEADLLSEELSFGAKKAFKKGRKFTSLSLESLAWDCLQVAKAGLLALIVLIAIPSMSHANSGAACVGRQMSSHLSNNAAFAYILDSLVPSIQQFHNGVLKSRIEESISIIRSMESDFNPRVTEKVIHSFSEGDTWYQVLRADKLDQHDRALLQSILGKTQSLRVQNAKAQPAIDLLSAVLKNDNTAIGESVSTLSSQYAIPKGQSASTKTPTTLGYQAPLPTSRGFHGDFNPQLNWDLKNWLPDTRIANISDRILRISVGNTRKLMLYLTENQWANPSQVRPVLEAMEEGLQKGVFRHLSTLGEAHPDRRIINSMRKALMDAKFNNTKNIASCRTLFLALTEPNPTEADIARAIQGLRATLENNRVLPASNPIRSRTK